MNFEPERSLDAYPHTSTTVVTYLLDRQVRELAFLKIRPVVTQLDIRDAEDVADHVPVHLRIVKSKDALVGWIQPISFLFFFFVRPFCLVMTPRALT